MQEFEGDPNSGEPNSRGLLYIVALNIGIWHLCYISDCYGVVPDNVLLVTFHIQFLVSFLKMNDIFCVCSQQITVHFIY